MKLHISIMAICLLTLTGCTKDLLEKTPTTTLGPSTFWKTQDDAIQGVNALYAYMPGYEEVSLDIFSDLAVSSAIAGNEYTRGQTSSDDPLFEGHWNRGYYAIRAANYFLENLETIEDIDVSMKARVGAEARFIRALRYTYLVAQFGDVPFFTNTLTTDEAATISSTPKSEIWNFIESELTAIVDDLPLSYGESEPERITSGGVLAFKARAMLYANRFMAARDAALAVINLNNYSLLDNYADLFKYAGENSSEVVLQTGYAQDVKPTNFPENGPNAGYNGKGRISVTRTLVDEYETITGKSITDADTDWNPSDPYANRDSRMQATIWLPVYGAGTFSDVALGTTIPFDTRPGQSGNSPDYVNGSNVATTTGFMLKKYLDPLDAANVLNGGINYTVIRYADVLLMYAEAKIELNEIDDTVINAINEVRQRPSVNLPPISIADQDILRDAVRHERMVELAMEGVRFYDIRRWKTAIDVMQGPIQGMRYLPLENEGAGESTVVWQATIRLYTEADYEFPIPFREVQINSNLQK